jgi:hypothetical protein
MRRVKLLLVVVVLFLASAMHAQAACPTGVLHCANVSWTWSQGTGGSATGYNIYRTLTSGGCATDTAVGCTKAGTVTAPTLTFTDSPLAPSTTYFWVITAYNSSGESPTSTQVTATTLADPVPASPANVTVTAK